MKLESLEFYAELLYTSRQLGGPKEFDKEQIAKLYEIRRKMGLPGKHTANLCAELNGPGKGCHSCDAACSCGEYQYFTLVKRGSTKELFLLYFPDQNRLCVVEDYV